MAAAQGIRREIPENVGIEWKRFPGQFPAGPFTIPDPRSAVRRKGHGGGHSSQNSAPELSPLHFAGKVPRIHSRRWIPSAGGAFSRGFIPKRGRVCREAPLSSPSRLRQNGSCRLWSQWEGPDPPHRGRAWNHPLPGSSECIKLLESGEFTPVTGVTERKTDPSLSSAGGSPEIQWWNNPPSQALL